MVGALFVVSAPVVDSPPCPSLCFDSSPVTKTSLRSGGDLVLQRKSKAKSHLAVSKSVDLRSSFINSGGEWRRSASGGHRSWRNQRRNRRLVVVNEFAGQYEDSFEDVKMFGSWRNVDPVVGGTRALNQIRPLEIAMKNVQEQSKMYSPSTLQGALVRYLRKERRISIWDSSPPFYNSLTKHISIQFRISRIES